MIRDLGKGLAAVGLALAALQLYRAFERGGAALPGPVSSLPPLAPATTRTAQLSGFAGTTVTAHPWLQPNVLLAVVLLLVSGTLYYQNRTTGGGGD